MSKTQAMKGFILIIFLVAWFRYPLIPNYPFPAPPPDALQSNEPADQESVWRKAYFTNYTRDQVIAHYYEQLKYIPLIRLNYPPEDAKIIIRDQTRSWYLEELAHPLRASLYINGFVPQLPQDTIIIDGKQYHQKITIKYVSAGVVTRVLVMFGILIFAIIIIKEWKKTLKSLL